MSSLESRLEQLAERGVVVVDPRQTFIDEEVEIGRVRTGVILHPGTRLCGPRTFLGPGAEIGREGPAVLRDAVLDEGARVDAGFVEGAVLLRGARLGAAAHVRAGTLLEEQASTAHAVGLKHTILLAFVTVGSLVNFCDCLMTGGTSREDHSEVGSGYIHFNFTPWGARGDKATPSLVGDVPRGVLLRERRVFLGGSGGMIGPRAVGFGAVVAAGQVLRDDVPEGQLVAGQRARSAVRPVEPHHLDGVEPRAARNVAYIGQLVALREWYRQVRLAREERAGRRVVLEEAIALLGAAVEERAARLDSFLRERGVSSPPLRREGFEPCPLGLAGGPVEHVEWVAALPAAARAQATEWLRGIVDVVAGR